VSGYSVFPVTGIPELREGDDLAELILARVELEDRDIVVVAQKAVSKVEGRVLRLDDIEPSARAVEIAGDEEDPRRIEAILREAKSIVRIRPPLVICETRNGFICASAGVDASNASEADTLILLPLDPDRSAAILRDTLHEPVGHVLRSTVIATGDEIAGAAQLVAGKLARVPVTIVRGLDLRGDGTAAEIPVPAERDLFR
jgi:coenzyme F420-0:L-glutamate ligase/coenzyme F420-1:gamma-L-glutamate ligase